MIKKTLWSFGTIAAIVIPTVTTVACTSKISLRSSLKNNNVSDEELNSKEGKALKSVIEKGFSYHFLKSSWADYLFDSGDQDRTWDATDESWELNELPPLSKVESTNDMDAALVSSKSYGAGNFAQDIYGSVINDVQSNPLVDKKIRGLLNQIRTIYNRNPIIYPIKEEIYTKDGIEWARWTYQMDLIATIDRRFMSHYTTLVGEVPLAKPSSKLLRNFFNIGKTTPKNISDLSMQLSRIFEGMATKGVYDKEFWTDPNQSGGKSDDINSLLGFKLGSNNKYQLMISDSVVKYDKATGAVTGAAATAIPIMDENDKAFEFNKGTKMSVVSQALSEYIFSGKYRPILKDWFGANSKWEGKVELTAISGASLDGVTIEDYIKNFTKEGQRNQRLAASIGNKEKTDKWTNYGFQNLGKFNIYITNKEDHSESFTWVENILPSQDGEVVS